MSKIKQLLEVKTMNTILAFMGLFLLAFTITMIVVFIKYQSVPDTLITSVFACLGAEGGFMSLIQTAKIKEKEESEDERID